MMPFRSGEARKSLSLLRGTECSNPSPSSGESGELPYCAAGSSDLVVIRPRSVPAAPQLCNEQTTRVLLNGASAAVAGIPKNRCRTTVAERMGERLTELPFIGDQVGLFRARPVGFHHP
jgi:hypothetical protein